MTRNKRYESHFDALNDKRIRHASPRPCTLPQQAYGPNPFTWVDRAEPVWAWVQFPHQPARRIPAFATGWNDRVVVVKWYADQGGAIDTIVWRNAVTKRTSGPPALG